MAWRGACGRDLRRRTRWCQPPDGHRPSRIDGPSLRRRRNARGPQPGGGRDAGRGPNSDRGTDEGRRPDDATGRSVIVPFTGGFRVSPVGRARRPSDDRAMTTVLVIDDHAAFRAQARALLSTEGYDVVGEA